MRFASQLEMAASVLPLSARRRLMYTAAHGRPPRLRDPKRFTEKINWRIVNDRRDLLRPLGDKMAMKDYAASRGANVLIPPTLWSGESLAEFLATGPTGAWVVKPNHRSGLVVFGDGGTPADPDMVVSTEWLEEKNGRLKGEWAYTFARRCLIAEPNISPDGSVPMDYKFYVFDGDVSLIHVDSNRFGGISRTFFDSDWRHIKVSNGFPSAPDLAPPANLPQMVDAASTLGAEFDFMRVDLYSDGANIWFGELTPYPAGGLRRYSPDSFDTWLGERWRLIIA